jgi:poly-gamma-glutamate synthesis protein (capsule biosynthesis protein)
MKLGSVEAVTLANNHTGDYGTLGYESTWDALVAAGVQPVDTNHPYVVEVKGVKIGVVGIYAAGYFAKRKMMKDAVQRARDAGADAVVVMVHAGQEYDGLHSSNQMLIARLLIDSGADVVIGTHPHVLQGMEVYGQRNILYSIGNFVFGGNATVRSNEKVLPASRSPLARITATWVNSCACTPPTSAARRSATITSPCWSRASRRRPRGG